MGRAMLALIAVMIVLGTGVAWGSVRSFEGGIFHFATAVLGAGGGKDGALDIMLVGMDSRTDAHGNPLAHQVGLRMQPPRIECTLAVEVNVD